jgi:hypothetical protein
VTSKQPSGRRAVTAGYVQALSVVVLLLLLALSLFSMLSYPLLWNDESETAMFGSRILLYGYPKIHHEQQIVYCDNWPDAALAIDQAHDAYVVADGV